MTNGIPEALLAYLVSLDAVDDPQGPTDRAAISPRSHVAARYPRTPFENRVFATLLYKNPDADASVWQLQTCAMKELSELEDDAPGGR